MPAEALDCCPFDANLVDARHPCMNPHVAGCPAGTGGPGEVGSGNGEGFTINVPWDGPGVSDGDMLAAFK
jgi:hypothetical protein